MTARKTQAPKDQEAADKAQGSQEIDLAGQRRTLDTLAETQEIGLAGQRRTLDNLAETLAGLDTADIGRAIDEARAQAGWTSELEPSVYLIHPVKGHVVHITVTQAIADGALGWADATLDDIRRAGLTG